MKPKWLHLTAGAFGSVLLLAVSNLSAATLYVSPGSTKPTPPYAAWTSAATNIQDAVNAATVGDAVVVSNGVYIGGVAVTNPVVLLSVNGPQFTVIDGLGTNQCVSLTNGASLTGFTLTNGYAAVSGGGVYCTSTNAFLTNCTLTGNSAHWGGGAYEGTLYNCTLTGNSALTFSIEYGGAGGLGGGALWSTLYNCTVTGNSAHIGGGVYEGTLYNCTLTGNSALPNAYGVGGYGGGAFGGTLYNCIVYYSDAPNGANYFTGITAWGTQESTLLQYSCTTPTPTSGFGNITNAPLFADYTNGNLRLQSDSPCINAANNAFATTATDLDGRPRTVSGTVDMGAYEYQPGVNAAFIGWLQQNGLPTDGSADYGDPDHDGMNNWQEWICGTDPTNPLSALHLLSPSITSTNAMVTWQSGARVNYFLERSASLAAPFTLLATNIVGQAGTTSYADTNAIGAGPFFYRVGVKSP